MPFRLIDNEGITDPRINLALEEYVARNRGVKEDLLLFYVNDPCVVLGKHQNVLEEIDLGLARERGVRVVRRISGGGAVYHDRGNLNFSILTRHDPAWYNRYEPFLDPIIAALRPLGIEATINSRNSLVVDDRKISGSAQFTSRERMLCHGTLLFESDLDLLDRVLQPREAAGITSHAVQSVRSRVVNLNEIIAPSMTMGEFRDHLIASLAGKDPVIDRLSEEEWTEVHRLAREKYDTWEWNYGRSPKYAMRREIDTERGRAHVELMIVDGIVVDVRLLDASDGANEMLRALRGKRFDEII